MSVNIAYNMDCMIAMREMPDRFFDLAVVDPPYGGVTHGGYIINAKSTERLAHSHEYHNEIWKQAKPGQEYFDELFRISKNQVIFGGNYFMREISRDSQCWLVWDKLRPEGVKFADCELAWTSFNLASRVFRYRWNGMLQGNMAAKEWKIHPTQKPVALYSWIYSLFTKPGDRIVDTHLGSGSSRIAAYSAGLDFTGYEIDKTYFDLQEQRFLTYSSQVDMFLDGWAVEKQLTFDEL